MSRRSFSTSAGHVAGACNCRECGGGSGDAGDALDAEALERLVEKYGAQEVARALQEIQHGDGAGDDVSGQSGRRAGGADLVDDYMGRQGALQSLADEDPRTAADGTDEGDGSGDGSDAVWAPYGADGDEGDDDGVEGYTPTSLTDALADE